MTRIIAIFGSSLSFALLFTPAKATGEPLFDKVPSEMMVVIQDYKCPLWGRPEMFVTIEREYEAPVLAPRLWWTETEQRAHLLLVSALTHPHAVKDCG